MKILKKIGSYITFWKPRPADEPSSFNLKMMHGINKISIVMFLFGMIYLLLKIFK